MSNVRIASGARDNLYSLRSTQRVLDFASSNLSSGLMMQNKVDDHIVYFKPQTLSERAETFFEHKKEITQTINLLKTTTHGLESLISFVNSMKRQILALRVADSETKFKAHKSTFNEMTEQYSLLAQDTKYRGQTLLTDSSISIDVKFSSDPSRKLTIKAKNSLASVIGLSGVSHTRAPIDVDISSTIAKASYDGTKNKIVNGSALDKAIYDIDKVAEQLKADSIEFGGKLSILNLRSELTDIHSNDLEDMVGDLIIPDAQREGANMLALQARQSLALNSLSIASSQDSKVLRLINNK